MLFTDFRISAALHTARAGICCANLLFGSSRDFFQELDKLLAVIPKDVSRLRVTQESATVKTKKKKGKVQLTARVCNIEVCVPEDVLRIDIYNIDVGNDGRDSGGQVHDKG